MKQILILAAAVLLAVSCSQKKAPKVLVLYYSQTNTTKVVAEEIANALGADLEAILPVVPYEGDIPAVAARCAKDAAEGKLPELKPFTVDVNAYDIVFLGYPIWMGTYAPPVEAAISAMNLDGKKVVPFCTFGSGGLDTSTKDLPRDPGVEMPDHFIKVYVLAEEGKDPVFTQVLR